MLKRPRRLYRSSKNETEHFREFIAISIRLTMDFWLCPKMSYLLKILHADFQNILSSKSWDIIQKPKNDLFKFLKALFFSINNNSIIFWNRIAKFSRVIYHNLENAWWKFQIWKTREKNFITPRPECQKGFLKKISSNI